MSIDRQGQFFFSTSSLAAYSSIPSLAGTQQQQHLHLHQQECGSAEAAPTARTHRVQKPMVHVSPNISCDYVTCSASQFFNLRHPRDFTSPTSRRETFFCYEHYVHTRCVTGKLTYTAAAVLKSNGSRISCQIFYTVNRSLTFFLVIRSRNYKLYDTPRGSTS